MYPYQTTNIPATGVSAVNIQIYGPTANATGGVPVVNPGQVYKGPVQAPPVAPVSNPVQTAPMPDTFSNSQAKPATETKKTEEKETKKKKKEIVQLTDNYIKTLESYLRDTKSADTRLMAAKELQQRFKEEKSRKDDTGLTPLLNVALQDPSPSVRFIALSTLNCGYANGDETTKNILKQIQNSTKAYGQDAQEAKEILLKMAGKKINITTDEIEDPSPKKEQTGNKLNLVSD